MAGLEPGQFQGEVLPESVRVVVDPGRDGLRVLARYLDRAAIERVRVGDGVQCQRDPRRAGQAERALDHRRVLVARTHPGQAAAVQRHHQRALLDFGPAATQAQPLRAVRLETAGAGRDHRDDSDRQRQPGHHRGMERGAAVQGQRRQRREGRQQQAGERSARDHAHHARAEAFEVARRAGGEPAPRGEAAVEAGAQAARAAPDPQRTDHVEQEAHAGGQAAGHVAELVHRHHHEHPQRQQRQVEQPEVQRPRIHDGQVLAQGDATGPGGGADQGNGEQQPGVGAALAWRGGGGVAHAGLRRRVRGCAASSRPRRGGRGAGAAKRARWKAMVKA